mmetsp:Transcript_38857/g.96068  ORF Transcript_38857/g.96068 Transcript_38857/m.96068 type:complete len:208 (+) Transcript_38857:2866-3489(+)
MRRKLLTAVTTTAATKDTPRVYVEAASVAPVLFKRAIWLSFERVSKSSSTKDVPIIPIATSKVYNERLRTSCGPTSKFSQKTSEGSGAGTTERSTESPNLACFVVHPIISRKRVHALRWCAFKHARLPASVSKMTNAAPLEISSTACRRAISLSRSIISFWSVSIFAARVAARALSRAWPCSASSARPTRVSASSTSCFFQRSNKRT